MQDCACKRVYEGVRDGISARVNVRMEARVKICAWSCSVLRDVVLGKNN